MKFHTRCVTSHVTDERRRLYFVFIMDSKKIKAGFTEVGGYIRGVGEGKARNLINCDLNTQQLAVIRIPRDNLINQFAAMKDTSINKSERETVSKMKAGGREKQGW